MLRVVLDTNIYVSALNFGGIPLEILLLGVRRKIAIFVSAAILRELAGVLRNKFKWAPEQVREATRIIRGFARIVVPQRRVALIIEDPTDNRILECAQATKADVTITGDRHLQKLKEFRSTPIVSPGEFLVRYQID